MAGFEKRKNSSGEVTYRVKIRVKGYEPVSATFSNKPKARAWAKRLESEMKDSRYEKDMEAKRRTVSEMIEKYKESHLIHKSHSMRCSQEIQLDWWRDNAGGYTLSEFKSSVISELRDKLLTGVTRMGKKRSNGTVNRYMSAISHVFTIAINEWDWLESNPALRIRRLKEPRGVVRFLDDDERARLLVACKESSNEMLYPVVILALSTGMRKSEILNIKSCDLFLKKGFVLIHDTKNDKPRRIPINGYPNKVLEDYISLYPSRNEYIFPDRSGEKPIDIRTPWENAVKAAGIINFRFHDLRHSCASYLAMNGATQRDLMEILGHKTVQMSVRYSHLSDNHIKSVVSDMNDKMFGGNVDAN